MKDRPIKGQDGAQQPSPSEPRRARTGRAAKPGELPLQALIHGVRAVLHPAPARAAADLEHDSEAATLQHLVETLIAQHRAQLARAAEQDWLQINLTQLTRIGQAQGTITTLARRVLSELVPLVGAHQGVFYWLHRPDHAVIGGDFGSVGASADADADAHAHAHAGTDADAHAGTDADASGATDATDAVLMRVATHGADAMHAVPQQITLGEGLVGQCAIDRRRLLLEGLPAAYLRVGTVLVTCVRPP